MPCRKGRKLDDPVDVDKVKKMCSYPNLDDYNEFLIMIGVEPLKGDNHIKIQKESASKNDTEIEVDIIIDIPPLIKPKKYRRSPVEDGSRIGIPSWPGYTFGEMGSVGIFKYVQMFAYCIVKSKTMTANQLWNSISKVLSPIPPRVCSTDNWAFRVVSGNGMLIHQYCTEFTTSRNGKSKLDKTLYYILNTVRIPLQKPPTICNLAKIAFCIGCHMAEFNSGYEWMRIDRYINRMMVQKLDSYIPSTTLTKLIRDVSVKLKSSGVDLASIQIFPPFSRHENVKANKILTAIRRECERGQ